MRNSEIVKRQNELLREIGTLTKDEPKKIFGNLQAIREIEERNKVLIAEKEKVDKELLENIQLLQTLQEDSIKEVS